MSAAYMEIIKNETLESLAELYCQLLDENAELKKEIERLEENE